MMVRERWGTYFADVIRDELGHFITWSRVPFIPKIEEWKTGPHLVTRNALGWFVTWKPWEPPVIPPPKPPVYRVHKAREYYAYERKRTTPNPFAEYRVWVYTERPEIYTEHEMGGLLNELEWAVSVVAGRLHIAWSQSVYETQNYEERRVDRDEFFGALDELEYYMVFYRDDTEYGTDAVKRILADAGHVTMMPSTVKAMGLRDWKDRPMPRRRY